MFKSIGTTEWLVIIAVVLIIFGGKKIPEFFKGLGESIREFKEASEGSSKKKD